MKNQKRESSAQGESQKETWNNSGAWLLHECMPAGMHVCRDGWVGERTNERLQNPSKIHRIALSPRQMLLPNSSSKPSSLNFLLTSLLPWLRWWNWMEGDSLTGIPGSILTVASDLPCSPTVRSHLGPNPHNQGHLATPPLLWAWLHSQSSE